MVHFIAQCVIYSQSQQIIIYAYLFAIIVETFSETESFLIISDSDAHEIIKLLLLNFFHITKQINI